VASIKESVNGEVDLEIDVQAPLWAEYDTIEIYRNAQTCVAGENGVVPVLFGAVPTLTLTAGFTDTGTEFTVSELDDFSGIPGQASRATVTAWPDGARVNLAVLVKATPGTSGPV
jgi:hypothetical protein